MRTSVPRLRSVRPKAGGAQLIILRGGQDPAAVRAKLLRDVEEMTAAAGNALRGYYVSVYDKDGCFDTYYYVDGQTLPFWAAVRAFQEAISRASAMSK